MTIRMSGLVSGKGAQPRVALGHPAAQAGGERRHDRRFEVADDRNPRESGQEHRGGGHEERRPEARAAAAKRPGDELRGSERAEKAAGAAPDRLVPLAEREADEAPEPGCEDDCGHEQRPRRAEQPNEQHADRDPQPRTAPDPVPTTHALSLVSAVRPAGKHGQLLPRGYQEGRNRERRPAFARLLLLAALRSGAANGELAGPR